MYTGNLYIECKENDEGAREFFSGENEDGASYPAWFRKATKEDVVKKVFDNSVWLMIAVQDEGDYDFVEAKEPKTRFVSKLRLRFAQLGVTPSDMPMKEISL